MKHAPAALSKTGSLPMPGSDISPTETASAFSENPSESFYIKENRSYDSLNISSEVYRSERIQRHGFEVATRRVRGEAAA